MFICVSLTCGSCCARTGPWPLILEGKERRPPCTHEEDAPRPRAEGSSGARFVSRSAELAGEARDAAEMRAQVCSSVGVCECVTSLRDLHMKRGHGGRLVDVTSLGMSVVDWHGRMEGGEELWCRVVRV